MTSPLQEYKLNKIKNDYSIEEEYIYKQIENELVKYKLYKVTKVKSGNDTQVMETEVSAVIAVMNGKITVQLPNIGSDEYVFKFRTQFNCLAAELSGKTIANTVNFTGTGKNWNNSYGPITIGPNASAYVGVFNGLISVSDS